MANKGCVGGIFDGDEILWFILIFLILFYCRPFGGYGPVAGATC